MMLNTKLLLFSIAFFGVCAGALSDFDSKSKDLPIASVVSDLPSAIDTADKHKTTTTTTTIAPTSSSTETSTTEIPTTTTTTKAPPTPPTSTPTTSTTTPPTTTTTTTSTTTLSPQPPTPIPAPKIGRWIYNDEKSNTTCIIVQFALQLNITYPTTENTTANVLYNLPVNGTTVSSGSCGNGTENQNIFLRWGSSTLGLVFHLNTTTQEVTLRETAISLNATEEFPKGNGTVDLWHVGNIFTVPKDKSYHCTKIQVLQLAPSEKSKETVAWADISHVQLEAYHKGSSHQFSIAKDCDAIDTPDIVPIAVGCALIALVVIVLIAYLVGRRRAQASGYVSM